MSRPIPRIALAVLLSLALLAGIYVTVLGASADGAGAAGAQARILSGLKTNFDHQQSSTLQKDGPCQSEAQVSPLDY